MALLNTVVRKYTPPTCTLEVRGRESLLSKWASRPVLKDLKFKLSFDDPRQPDDKQVSIWGDRIGLEALSTAVSEYIQNFLQSRDGELEVNGKQPVVDVLPRKAANSNVVTDLPATKIAADRAIASDTEPTKVIPISPVFQNQTLNPYLKPKGLVTHELFLGALQTPESGSSIDLSALQLFDLATALDAYGAEMLSVPPLGKTRPAIPLWGYAAGAAALVAAGIGLAPAAMRLAGTSTVVVLPSPQENPVATEVTPSTDLALAPPNPASPAPLVSPSPGVAVLPGQSNVLPSAAPPGAIPPGTNIPPGASIPPGAISSNIPSLPNGLGTTPQPVPGATRALTAPPGSTPIPPVPGASGNKSPNVQFGQRSAQYGLSPGVTLQPLGGSTTDRRSTSGATSPLKRFIIGADGGSRTATSSQNRSSKNSQASSSKKTRSTVPAISSGAVEEYVFQGDNPSDLASISGTQSQPSRSRVTRSKKAGSSSGSRPTTITQSPQDLQIAAAAPTIPKFTTQDLTPAPSIEPGAQSEPEASAPVVPQFSPNPNPPALGEIPALSDNATIVVPPPETSSATSNNSGNPVTAAPTLGAPSVSPPSDASALTQPSSPAAPLSSANSTSVNNDLAAVRNLDSAQSLQVKRYFEGQWKPIKEVKQSLDYTLAIEPNGSVTRIIPITEISRQYIERTGMPKLTNTPMIAPVGGSQTVKIRVSLEPDGTVRTFQEQ